MPAGVASILGMARAAWVLCASCCLCCHVAAVFEGISAEQLAAFQIGDVAHKPQVSKTAQQAVHASTVAHCMSLKVVLLSDWRLGRQPTQDLITP